MKTRVKLGRNVVAFIVLALLAIMVARVARTYSIFNATFDEETHLTSGLVICTTILHGTEALQPVLSTLALGALPCVSGFRPDPSWPFNERVDGVLGKPGRYWHALTLARMGNLLFAPLLVYFVYRWSFEVLGRAAAIAAVLMVTTSPTVMALTGLATVDFGITTGLLVSAYQVHRWMKFPSLAEATKAGLAAGFVLMSKHSAIGYLPLIVAGSFALAAWDRRNQLSDLEDLGLRRAVPQFAVFVGAGFLLIWAVYGFRLGPLSDPQTIFRQTVDRFLSQQPDIHRVGLELLEEGSLPAPAFFDGLAVGGMLARNGSPSYLLGEIRKPGGWWYYFPVATTVKMTIPFLILIVVGFISADKAARRRLAYPALAALSVFGIGVASTMNVGIRHVLPMFPFLAIVASAPFARGRKPTLTTIACILIAWHGCESFAAHPDYLAYFNQFARGREHRVLGDSNLDWGQDLARLARYVESEGIGPIHLAYFGTAIPEAVGLTDYVPFQPKDRPRGWVAVSVTHLQGIYLRDITKSCG